MPKIKTKTKTKNKTEAKKRFRIRPGGTVKRGHQSSFLDLFQITKLDKLSKEELITCLRSLALARGVEGAKVLQLIENDSARIKTLHDLTGGNPRTLTLLYLLLEVDTEGDVFSDLERLLDQVTVLYKARVEDLPPQARVILDAVALAWNPILAADVATKRSISHRSLRSASAYHRTHAVDSLPTKSNAAVVATIVVPPVWQQQKPKPAPVLLSKTT